MERCNSSALHADVIVKPKAVCYERLTEDGKQLEKISRIEYNGTIRVKEEKA